MSCVPLLSTTRTIMAFCVIRPASRLSLFSAIVGYCVIGLVSWLALLSSILIHFDLCLVP